ncbi:hypothetical protein [Methanolobus halotolerans]|nr:hypothetical protein [Methanolobus halotolerans]
MAITIEGTAFPLGEINKNGWGIPFSEADNAISSLKGSVLRICPRDAPHECDFSEDPNAEIGRVVDAWREGPEIKARASVTDSVAERKIQDGTWENTWSVYSLADSINDSWASGVHARSLTLVQTPAWEQATWNIAAAEDGKVAVRNIHQFKIIASGDHVTDNKDNPKGGGDPSPDEKLAELEKDKAVKEKEIEDLKATKAELETKVENLEKVVASYEKDKATSVPLEQVQELVANKADEIATAKITAYKEEQRRASAMDSFTAARKDLNLETIPENFQHLTASDIEKLAEDLGSIKLGASVESISYPSSTGAGTVGRWDSTKKEWVVG